MAEVYYHMKMTHVSMYFAERAYNIYKNMNSILFALFSVILSLPGIMMI